MNLDAIISRVIDPYPRILTTWVMETGRPPDPDHYPPLDLVPDYYSAERSMITVPLSDLVEAGWLPSRRAPGHMKRKLVRFDTHPSSGLERLVVGRFWKQDSKHRKAGDHANNEDPYLFTTEPVTRPFPTSTPTGPSSSAPEPVTDAVRALLRSPRKKGTLAFRRLWFSGGYWSYEVTPEGVSSESAATAVAFFWPVDLPKFPSGWYVGESGEKRLARLGRANDRLDALEKAQAIVLKLLSA